MEIPKACVPVPCSRSDLHLTSSPDGRLSLLVADRFVISIWRLSGSTGWARQAVIDTEEIVRSVSPDLTPSDSPSRVDFVSSGVRSGAVLLRPFASWDFQNDQGEKGLLLDLDTEEMRRVETKEKGDFVCEIDLEARLSAMKIFD